MLTESDLYSTENEIQYFLKLDWFWKQISEDQRHRIRSSVISSTLQQQKSSHCVIGTATEGKTASKRPIMRKMMDVIFYDGPTYDGLFGRKVTSHEKKILDDIYYARIDFYEDYVKANCLVYKYVTEKIGNC